MCGLAGLAGADPTASPGADARADIAVMLSTLAHRGPDGEGIRVLPGAALGHRRLAIIDLSDRGAQPMPLRCARLGGRGDDDPRVWVVLNGEIYNHRELRADLENRGHTFHSGSDTEAVLHLYEERGADCVLDLRGMFAFALWDAVERRLLLARDRLGKKPLYYRLGPGGIAFASEMKALAALARARGESSEADHAALRRYLALKYVPGPGTAIRGILKLPPASILTYASGRAQISSYWSLPEAAIEGRTVDRERLSEELRETVRESVALRMRSDVPLGLFLSGGLDSAIIASCMTALVRDGVHAGPIRTFTVDFKEADYGELRQASEVARALGTEHHEIPIRPTAAQTADILPDLAAKLDQPFADSSAVAVYHLAREVRHHVTVALSGDGGDELFLGYDRYRAHRLAGRLGASIAATGVTGRLSRALAAALPGAPGRRNLAGRARRFLAAAGLTPLERNDAWITCLDPALAASVAPGLCGPEDPLDAIHAAYGGGQTGDPGEALLASQRADLLVWLPDDILHKADAACMAHSLESRAPLLDHRVVELAMRIPVSLKLRAGRGKAILRDAFARDLPVGVIRRRKAGFGLPLDHWLRHELAGYCRDLLLDSRTLSRGIFSREGIETILRDHVKGRENREDAIWALVMLEHWFRSALDFQRASAAGRSAAEDPCLPHHHQARAGRCSAEHPLHRVAPGSPPLRADSRGGRRRDAGGGGAPRGRARPSGGEHGEGDRARARPGGAGRAHSAPAPRAARHRAHPFLQGGDPGPMGRVAGGCAAHRPLDPRLRLSPGATAPDERVARRARKDHRPAGDDGLRRRVAREPAVGARP
jgi:asparagine synthase (glutamine-hydrolysing)